jgi:hypothetical protein
MKTKSELNRMNLRDLIAYAKTLGVARFKVGSGFTFDDFSKWTKAEIIEMIQAKQ